MLRTLLAKMGCCDFTKCVHLRLYIVRLRAETDRRTERRLNVDTSGYWVSDANRIGWNHNRHKPEFDPKYFVNRALVGRSVPVARGVGSFREFPAPHWCVDYLWLRKIVAIWHRDRADVAVHAFPACAYAFRFGFSHSNSVFYGRALRVDRMRPPIARSIPKCAFYHDPISSPSSPTSHWNGYFGRVRKKIKKNNEFEMVPNHRSAHAEYLIFTVQAADDRWTHADLYFPTWHHRIACSPHPTDFQACVYRFGPCQFARCTVSVPIDSRGVFVFAFRPIK